MNYKKSSYKETARNTCHNSLTAKSQTDDRYRYINYCYSSEAVRKIDQLMVDKGVVDNSYQLMSRASEALLRFINLNFSKIDHITIICGAGNNAGDGYVLARLAKQKETEPHLKVHLISIIDPEQLKGDAHQAYKDWKDCGGTVETMAKAHFPATDLIIDALIGTGLDRPLENEWFEAVEAINASNKPILSVDIPSGLSADTGAVLGTAINAQHTLTFIGQKMGMYTAMARHHCGEIHFASLGVSEELYHQVEHDAVLMDWSTLAEKLPCRSPISHKGDHGHLLIIGGDHGMSGACRIAGEAALRAGVGLVSIATRKENINSVNSARPELMVHGVETAHDLEPLLKKATTVAIGPGLGTDQWGMALLDKIIKLLKHQEDTDGKKITCVIDADALNLMAQHNLIVHNPDIIYTPHFGEASRLLKHNCEHPSTETDRFSMARELRQKYFGTFVLKGAGTLVNLRDTTSLEDEIFICPYGNEGMASAGMGDCLTGIIGALLAQKLSSPDATQLGVCIHAKAGDLTAKEGKIGMIVSDLLPKIRQLMND
ncbi:MAG: NAD(P)H-hydrate dehydratase [Gammaproteobacteria bacterium]|nr:NAD(P)H-hydrate dehydratase [Gammaproteobacteria bacterium]